MKSVLDQFLESWEKAESADLSTNDTIVAMFQFMMYLVVHEDESTYEKLYNAYLDYLNKIDDINILNIKAIKVYLDKVMKDTYGPNINNNDVEMMVEAIRTDIENMSN